MSDAFDFDRIAIRRAFNRASASFDAAAVLHREMRERLLARLQLIRLSAESTPQVIVDLGAGTGHGSRALKQRFPKATVIAIDFAEAMLQTSARLQGWRGKFNRWRVDPVCGDAHMLPLKNSSVDWAISNGMLQCCAPDAVFAEVQRVLKPNGLFSFTSFGPDTLRELRTAWSRVDEAAHVLPFIDMHDLGDALLRAGFADPVLDVEPFVLTYASIPALLADLKATGSTFGGHTQTNLGNRRQQVALTAAYETFRRDGVLPATIEVVFGQAWNAASPTKPGPHTGSGSEIRIPINAIRGSRR